VLDLAQVFLLELFLFKYFKKIFDWIAHLRTNLNLRTELNLRTKPFLREFGRVRVQGYFLHKYFNCLQLALETKVFLEYVCLFVRKC